MIKYIIYTQKNCEPCDNAKRILNNENAHIQERLLDTPEKIKRFKDDVNDVRNGTECGIGVRNYNDVRSGDSIEVFDTKEIAREL